ncbi:MAG: amino acid synthesis family protein [Dongiaceae bacterium]
MDTRKTLFIKETVHGEVGRTASAPVSRVAAIAVIVNPFAGRFVDDLSPLFDIGMQLGEQLMPAAVALLDGKPMSYGKAAIVGVNGDGEHAAAVLHPKLGKPMRAAVGGGEAIILSNTKVAAAGTLIDVPLANKDNIWSFDELDTMTVLVPDAPRPDEILVVMAVSDGGRVHPRVGKGRAAS